LSVPARQVKLQAMLETPVVKTMLKCSKGKALQICQNRLSLNHTT
jgi:hypothetical protein